MFLGEIEIKFDISERKTIFYKRHLFTLDFQK